MQLDQIPSSGPHTTVSSPDPRPQIGRIVSVSGSHATARLDAGSEPQADPLCARVEIGAVMRVLTPKSEVVGLVSGLTLPERADEAAAVRLDLVGEIVEDPATGKRRFRRGMASLPALGDAVHFAGRDDLLMIYLPRAGAAAKIGRLYQDAGIPAQVTIDDLLSKHFAIVGTTGSGKSCALACILNGILADLPHGHVVVLDIHNEYGAAFGERAEIITPATLQIPYWLLNYEEIVDVLASRDSYRDAEATILCDAITTAKRRYIEGAVSRTGTAIRRQLATVGVSIDTPTPYRLSDVTAVIDEQLGKLDRTQHPLPYRRLKARIESLSSDARYAFMFGHVSFQDAMLDILGRIFRVPTEGRPITILDLSAVPSEILNVVVSTLCRMTFDLGVWSKGTLPITLVCEEAHRYAPQDAALGFEPTRRALARIAKEGRKYRISLGLVTQRPSELDPTILSQCNTVFAMRLSNQHDQQVLRSAAADSALGLLEFLPALGEAEAIALGQGVTLPMRIHFDRLPGSAIPSGAGNRFSEMWRNETLGRSHLEQVVARWRLSKRDEE